MITKVNLFVSLFNAAKILELFAPIIIEPGLINLEKLAIP